MDAHLRRISGYIAAGCCLLYLLLGSVWIDRIGIQTDEALFAAGIFAPFNKEYCMRAFHHDIPLMTMTYVGTAKSWIWAPIYAFWTPSPASTRIPAVMLGAISVWLFYRMLLRCLGVRAAVVGCALLATDTMYLLLKRWDCTVAMQHLCFTAGLASLIWFQQTRKRRALALGFFIFGIGLWDKAIFSWCLAGLGIATLAVFPSELRKALTVRNIGIAVVAFMLGALPLLIFNVRHRFVTFRSNTVWSAEDLKYKVNLLYGTWKGESLFGSITRENWDGPARDPATTGERAVVSFSELAGIPRKNLLGWALGAAALLLPFVRRTSAFRAAVFATIFCAVAFALMAFTKGAGTGAHHSVLLWPMPHLFVAGVFAAASQRIPRVGASALVAGTVVLCFANVALTATYYSNMLRYGGSVGWTEAFAPFSDYLASEPPEVVCIVDWGFFDNLRLMHEGRLQLCIANDPTSDENKRYARMQIGRPGTVFVSHTEGNEFSPGAQKRLVEFATEEGYRKVAAKIFKDLNGRPTIELFRLERAAGSN